MSSELAHESSAQPRPLSVAGQIYKAQRKASRRLALQFLFALDSQENALALMEQELATFPTRIAEAKLAQLKAEHTPPPVDEEGTPLPVVKPTALLSDQLTAQENSLRTFLEEQRALPTMPDEEWLEAFFTLAEECWSEGLASPEAEEHSLPDSANHRILRKGWSRARKLVAFAMENHETIDRLVSQAADNWRLDRMSQVDRNILRIATAELKFDPNVSPAIIINEGIELAKSYGQKDSWRFVNGVLDHIRKILSETPFVIDGTVPESTTN
ncbi:MAG: transcription antitermination factor NusB [Victivallales bacterium]|nr:transcription antitermination factor NusB [Victivallales bacterium]